MLSLRFNFNSPDSDITHQQDTLAYRHHRYGKQRRGNALLAWIAGIATKFEQAESASQRVWALPELAELIFLELPPREILVNVQRTCRQWKAVVDGSTAAQQALFFKPISDQRLHYEAWNDEEDAYPGLTTQETLEGARPVASPISFTGRGCWCRLREIMSRPGMDHPNASWKRQLLTQPPLAGCSVWRAYGPFWRVVEIEGAESGMMAAQLRDQAYDRRICGVVQGQRTWQTTDWTICSARMMLSKMGKPYEYTRERCVRKEGDN